MDHDIVDDLAFLDIFNQKMDIDYDLLSVACRAMLSVRKHQGTIKLVADKLEIEESKLVKILEHPKSMDLELIVEIDELISGGIVKMVNK